MSCRCVRVGAGEERRSAPPHPRGETPAGWENTRAEVLRKYFDITERCAAVTAAEGGETKR